LMAMNPYPPGAAYQATAARPWFNFPNLAQRQGSLFQGGFFSNNRSSTYSPANSYLASNTPYNQQSNGWGPTGSTSALGFRPMSNPIPTMNTPTQASGWNGTGWGMPASNSYRDPLQGGMPATEMR
jgi:hypothetical protein